MDDNIHDAMIKLLHNSGYPDPVSIEDITGGLVNKNYKLDFKDMPPLKLKYYFSEKDVRDRCSNEFSFSRFAWDCGITNIPEPVAYEPDYKIGIYRYIDGIHIEPPVDDNLVWEASYFWESLHFWRHKYINEHSHEYHAINGVESYIKEVERRYAMFDQIVIENDIDREAASLACELIQIKNGIVFRLHAKSGNISYRNLNEFDRSIHPGDFSFRNVLTNTDDCYFFDFEYARHDDPCCVAVDFLMQSYITEYTLSENDKYIIIHGILRELDRKEDYLKRITEYWPLCQLKWCRIMLSIFLPIGRAKQAFSSQETNLEAEKLRRLGIAKRLAGELQEAI